MVATSSGSVASWPAAVIAGTVLGLLLDRALGTEPVFTMAGVFLGMLAGALGFWARVRAALRVAGQEAAHA